MPANKKYLTKSPVQRFAKISAGMLGGYLITALLHILLSYWINRADVLLTLRFGGFILWAGLLIVAFVGKNGWKTWGIYFSIILLLSLSIYWVR